MCHLGVFAGLVVHGAAVLITSGEDDEVQAKMKWAAWCPGSPARCTARCGVLTTQQLFLGGAVGSPVVPLVPVKLLKHFLSCRLFSLSVSLSDWRK